MDIFNNKNDSAPKENESKNPLNDIILDEKSKNSDLKKIALLAGSAILLLVIVIAIVKLTSQESKEPVEDFFETQTLTQNAAPEQDNFQQVPIIKEEPEPVKEYEKMAQEIVKSDEKTIPPKEEKPKDDNTVTKEPTKNKTETVSQSVEKAPNVKPLATKSEPKTVAKPQSGAYYIQVGAFYRLPPSKEYLRKIEKSGYKYLIKTVINNKSEVKKVLIGPYPDRNAARKALKKIKQSINKEAFIVRI